MMLNDFFFFAISSGTAPDTVVEGLEIESLSSQYVATHQERTCQPDYCEAIYSFIWGMFLCVFHGVFFFLNCIFLFVDL